VRADQRARGDGVESAQSPGDGDPDHEELGVEGLADEFVRADAKQASRDLQAGGGQ
jgi:hypothetical protein